MSYKSNDVNSLNLLSGNSYSEKLQARLSSSNNLLDVSNRVECSAVLSVVVHVGVPLFMLMFEGGTSSFSKICFFVPSVCVLNVLLECESVLFLDKAS